MSALFERTFTALVAQTAPVALAELTHSLRQLIGVLGLAELSGVLVAASPVLPDAVGAVAERLAYGHAQLVAVHAAEVSARALILATAGIATGQAAAITLAQARQEGPVHIDPRRWFTQRVHLLTVTGGVLDVRGLCQELAVHAARIGVHLEDLSRELSAATQGHPQTATTRPAPPCDDTEDSDAS